MILNVGYDSGLLTANTVVVIAKKTDTTAAWVPYTGPLTHIDWLAVG